MKTYVIYNSKGETVARVPGTQIMSADGGTTILIYVEKEIVAVVPTHNLSAVVLEK